MSHDLYRHNPLIHSDRRLEGAPTPWVRRFSCEDLRPLIICRGPIRKEAMDVFEEMGIYGYGILLSEKDSITYPNALAPELRALTDSNRVHRVPDYSGATKEERLARIQQIIHIARTHGYDSIFAGYGFMSEDEEMVRSMEQAGLTFIGPCSYTQGSAGLKDKAKRTALDVGVSVTPGVDDATTQTLLKRAPTLDQLKRIAEARELSVDLSRIDDPRQAAERLLEASYMANIDLYTVEELAHTLSEAVGAIFNQHPSRRVRLKAISGGGGKGQRILSAPTQYGDFERDLASCVNAAIEPIPSLIREILAEVKCTGVGDNKNILAELNIETTRHQEIQVAGNGHWCVTLGGRDCSLQMHEQKLLEVSVTEEELLLAIESAQTQGGEESEASRTLRADLKTLQRMESEATRFGVAVGLDSVSTFECIVDGDQHFFMEMNTRIQVEHRVTELCYTLTFSNPERPEELFVVTSLVELMVLLARHGEALPKPVRAPRLRAAVEARMNATNDALKPHAGGVIHDWSDPIEGEVRDDQGICLRNPDTGVFMRYHLAGAYDSNIALTLATGDHRRGAYEEMSEVLRQMKIEGETLATNLKFHYGLVNWFLGRGVNARPTTKFIVPYLTAVGALKREASKVDLSSFTHLSLKEALSASGDRAAELNGATREVLIAKSTLTSRPVEVLMREPHLLSGWLCRNHKRFEWVGGRVKWLDNPLEVLADLYQFLNMEPRPGRAALQQIWRHDQHLLSTGLDFYRDLSESLSLTDRSWGAIKTCLSAVTPPDPFNDESWSTIRGAHLGHQLGLEPLSILPYLAQKTGFFDLSVNSDLSIHIPDRLLDPQHQANMSDVLAPPPQAKSDEIVAPSGGMFYPREAPGMAPMIEVGDHFDEGAPLFIVEVMKMFNKVYAPFSGVLTSTLVEGDGVIIKKGQSIFKVKPDVELEIRDPAIIASERRDYTQEMISALNGGSAL